LRNKKACENACLNVAQLISDPKKGPNGIQLTETSFLFIRSLRQQILDLLSKTPGGIDPILQISIPKGVAYHHAGLTIEEREIIENSFRNQNQSINVLMATSTLAAGVNLPARRVIFRSPFIGNQYLDPTKYMQMSGRSGRSGKDIFGESFIIAQNSQLNLISNIINKTLPPLQSCLTEGRRGMTRPLMEAIASNLVQTIYDVEKFIRSTLFAAQRYFILFYFL
jgi:DNA polymerase theta